MASNQATARPAVTAAPPPPRGTAPDIAQQRQTYDPAAYFYKVRNDRSLEHGPLATVIARVANWDVYDPVLAHYLAYCISLEADSLTTPAYAVAERLRWTPRVEYTEYDDIGLLMMHVDESVILAFRSTRSYDEVEHDLSRPRQTMDSRLPSRIAIAERHRQALKHDPTTQLPHLPRAEDEALFEVTGEKVSVLSSLSNRYQVRASEVRSFVEEHLGAPIPLLDSVRLMLADGSRPREADHGVVAARGPQFDGLARYHTARPHILITGFGVGGAVAQLCALDMAALYGRAMVCTYTFGQCKLGNYAFAKLFSRLGGRFFRVVNTFDPIPTLPRKLMGLSHPSESRVRYSYPPTLGREYYLHGTAPPSKRERLSLLKSRGRGLIRSDVQELRLHTNYCGIQIPARLSPMEPFPFVVYRMVDDAPPQEQAKHTGRPPQRAELDLHQAQSVLPWDLILRDLAPAQRTAMRHRLEVYSGSRQSPWSTYGTPREDEGEQTRGPADEGHIAEPGVPDYTGTGTYQRPPLQQPPPHSTLPGADEGEAQKGRHIRFVAGGNDGIGAL